jgi:hypothetical protein
MSTEEQITERFRLLSPALDERTRRLWAAAEARVAGYGGAAMVARATGVSRRAIADGLKELEQAPSSTKGRVRRPGGGRKSLVTVDPTLREDLLSVVDSTTRGDPDSCLRWTCKSVRNLAAELKAKGHQVCPQVVANLLHAEGFSLQANHKTQEGGAHPDRNAQFEYLSTRVKAFIDSGQPAISVDAKKKELVGDFKNSGREWRPAGDPEKVRVHDFLIPELGRATPFGVYDLAHNEGWVSVGADHDTAAFAVQSIRRWWYAMGRATYPNARRLLITADAGGSNGARVRLWKLELQKLADETGMNITVCHLPPGTSKWNKIEHRLFSFITQNWRGKPLISHEVIVSLIAATTTRTGLRVAAELDTATYPRGTLITEQQMRALRLHHHWTHGQWNYTILTRPPPACDC